MTESGSFFKHVRDRLVTLLGLTEEAATELVFDYAPLVVSHFHARDANDSENKSHYRVSACAHACMHKKLNDNKAMWLHMFRDDLSQGRTET